MRATATEMNRHFGAYAHKAIKEPVVVEKAGNPFVVVVSYELFEKLEDAYWGNLAKEAEKDKSLSPEESMAFLKSLGEDE